RRVVGVLRDPGCEADQASGSGTAAAPVTGMAALDVLARTARQLGNPVSVERRGLHRELPPIADMTLYRVAQEALSNVRQYAAGASIQVTLSSAPEQVALYVENGPTPDDGQSVREARQGFGLIGMTERVQLVGGTLSFGPTSTGGWRVAVTLPVDAEPSGVAPRGVAPVGDEAPAVVSESGGSQ
ncbi:MAG: sensor histidine kinase, partial [Stackebrandtia sp.]